MMSLDAPNHTLPLTDEIKTEVTALLFKYLDEHTTDLAPSTRTVDPAVYFDPDIAAAERAGIFAHVPIVAAHSSEVSEPGAYKTVQMPNNELVVIRQPDGSVKAVVNMCRHRGAQLVADEVGCARLLSCRYHGWSYNLDGTLRAIANEPTFGEVDKDCFGLVTVPVEERHGFVWVVDNPDATIDVAEWLGPEIDESLRALNLDTYTCYRVEGFRERINWKVLMDAFLDAYHLASTHRGTVAPYFYNNVQVWQPFGRHGRNIAPRKRIDRIRDQEPGSVPIDDYITLAHFFMPNMSLLRQPDHFELLNFVPDPFDPERSRMEMRILIAEPVTTDEERERWDRNWDILMAVLRDEDLVVNRALQQSVRNRSRQPLIFGRNEIVNQHFHDWLERAQVDPRHWG